jgi:hypothetical protein
MSYHDPYNHQPFNPHQAYGDQADQRIQPTFPSRATQIVVEELVVVPTGTYQQQYRRPFVTELNTGNINQVYEVVGHSYNEFRQRQEAGAIDPMAQYQINPLDLAPVSANFIVPAAFHEAPARLNLAQGLHLQTARFLLRIAVYRHGAVEPQRFLMNGYTNFMGIIQKQMRAGLNNSDYTLDPQMELTVNSVMEVIKTTRDYGYGPQSQWEMHSVHQVLLDTQFDSVDNANVIRMRPYEVAATLSRMNDPKLLNSGISTTDTRYMQNGTPTFSDVHNTNPNNYMAKIIGGLATGHDMAIKTGNNSAMQPYTVATRLLRDPAAADDPFLKALANYGSGQVSATFKFRDLLMIDPNAESDQVLKINLRDYNQFKGARRENMAVGQDTSPWHGQDLSTQWANQINNILSPLMMDNGIRALDLFASNSNRESVCWVTNGVPYMPGVNPVPQLEIIKHMFTEQFINPMTGGGRWHRYDLDIAADLNGDIVTKISIDGKPQYTYVHPAFMSASMPPVLTSQPDTLDQVATQFHQLQQAVTRVVEPLATDLLFQTPPSGTRY